MAHTQPKGTTHTTPIRLQSTLIWKHLLFKEGRILHCKT